MTEDSTLHLELGPRSYDIIVGERLLDDCGHHIRPLMSGTKAVIITDSNVAPLYLERTRTSLAKAGIQTADIELPAGEATKDMSHLTTLLDELFRHQVDRTTTLIALGGGVIGDITGFAAAITMRGLSFIQIPTTLLAQVDSSVGGKTGINSSYGKNLIGAFHQPKLVLADISTLKTLPKRELLAGYAEVLKYGLIDDVGFFEWLEENASSLLDGDLPSLRHAVLTSCSAKADIVAQDELEKGRRALLNLGHTFGHALEAETGYGNELLHGEAVAIGMVQAFDFSSRSGLCPESDADRVRLHLQKTGLPTDLANLDTTAWTADKLMQHMELDKKVQDGRLVFILARAIGETFISNDVAPDDLRSFLQELDGLQV